MENTEKNLNTEPFDEGDYPGEEENLKKEYVVDLFKKMINEKLYNCKKLAATNDYCNGNDELYADEYTSSNGMVEMIGKNMSGISIQLGSQSAYESILNFLVYDINDQDYKKEDLKLLISKLKKVVRYEKKILEEDYKLAEGNPRDASEILRKVGNGFMFGRVTAYDEVLFWLENFDHADEYDTYNDVIAKIENAKEEAHKKFTGLSAVAPHEINFFLYCNYNEDEE